MIVSKLHLTLLQTIEQYRLFDHNSHILVALSGGGDSVALTYLLRELQQTDWLNLKISLAHLNHGLRGAEADRDEKFVRQMALDCSLPLFVAYLPIKDHLLPQENIEAAARRIRYNFLQSTAIEINAQTIVTAHHMNDQAETLLMRLLRGSGPQGLAGILPALTALPDSIKSDTLSDKFIPVVRPLLNIKRSEIEDYLHGQAISYCQDSTNRDENLLRNHIRHTILPQLMRLNPNIVESLARTAELCRLDYETEIDFSRLPSKLPTYILQVLPRPLVYHLLRAFIRRNCGDRRRISKQHIEALADFAHCESGKSMTLPDDRMARIESGYLIVEKVVDRIEIVPPTSLLLGEKICWGGYTISFHPLNDWEASGGGENEWLTCVDRELCGQHLLVRSRKPGDRFLPVGNIKPEKVGRLMIEAGIPISRREHWPLITTLEDEIIWSPRLRCGKNFAPKPSTGYFAIIRIKC